MNGIIILIDLAFMTFEDFIISEHCQCCVESVNALNKIICLVRMLLFLTHDLNNIDQTIDQIHLLIDNYEVCRKTFYRIKKLIHTMKSQ